PKGAGAEAENIKPAREGLAGAHFVPRIVGPEIGTQGMDRHFNLRRSPEALSPIVEHVDFSWNVTVLEGRGRDRFGDVGVKPMELHDVGRKETVDRYERQQAPIDRAIGDQRS